MRAPFFSRFTSCAFVLAGLAACSEGDKPPSGDTASSGAQSNTPSGGTFSSIASGGTSGTSPSGGVSSSGGAHATSVPRPNKDVEDPHLTVLSWNGHPAAASLTFDGADPSQFEQAEPVLSAHQYSSTFFVVSSALAASESNEENFRTLHEQGHEIANNTANNVPSSSGSVAEITDCDAYIEDTFGVLPSSFAYPEGDVTATYRDVAEASYVASRGHGSDADVPLSGPEDWYDIPSWFVAEPVSDPGTFHSPEETMTAIDATLAAGAWRVLVFNGIGPDGLYANTDQASLGALIHSAFLKDFWVDNFSRVAGYLRAQLALEALTPESSSGQQTWTWSLPPRFPPDVRLRVVVDGGTLTQAGETLEWNAEDGYYPMDPLKLELTWTQE